MQVFPHAVESALLHANQGWVWSDLSELKWYHPYNPYTYLLFDIFFWCCLRKSTKIGCLPGEAGPGQLISRDLDGIAQSGNLSIRATLGRKSEQGFVWFGFVRRLPTNDFAPQEERASLHFSQVPLQFARKTQEDQVKQCLGKEPEYMHHWAAEGCTSNDHILVCMLLVSWFNVHRTQIFDNICIWLRIQTKTDRQCSCN